MSDLALILVATVLVNNFVLAKFLGLCPFMGVSRKPETATGMALATTFVLTLSSASSYLVNAWIPALPGIGNLSPPDNYKLCGAWRGPVKRAGITQLPRITRVRVWSGAGFLIGHDSVRRRP